MKNWTIKNSARSLDVDRFERFSKILEMVSEDEANLILDLTEQFDKYTVDSTLLGLGVALELSGLSIIENCEKIFVFPLVDQSEADTNKSGGALAYPFLHTVLKPYMKKHSISKIITDYRALKSIKRHNDRRNSLIIAVDDFLGSGSTARKFIDEFDLLPKENCDTLLILTAAAMNSGLIDVSRTPHRIFTGTIYSKGISESPIITDTKTALSIMDKIEQRIFIETGCSRGYGSCESLVSFTRTPDNTFPLYWSNRKIDGEEWPCPFPR